MNYLALNTVNWHFNWLTSSLALALIIFQIVTFRKGPPGKQIVFYSGVVLMWLVTNSPLAFLGKNYLFSIHMAIHIILLLIVPPLLLNSVNPALLKKLSQTGFRKVGKVLFSVPVAWFTGMFAMYLWHIPSVFEAVRHVEFLRVLNILSLLLAGIIFIWPVYSPISWKRLTPLQSALYLFIACVGCTVLGILITFAPADIYIPLLSGSDPSFWNYIRSELGITAANDQQLGGLVMWVPACIIYLTNVLIILAGYFNRSNTQDSND